ncbi:G2/M phase-specific E3 ubiquitin-protein ligase [Rhinatrema bivittatum]|uniref:G2/M phase-specific E3 ubiquitin-protein ligase n=1 Tax=Rhinatrema bivittatum TaxID=194408 RepID=UPI00112D967F|nr:G2/M phase-specific E3 ubiquitin-protein ligase [Rhinatrema bivittatum]XP_029454867.1 G2/M phase-specific E3 ubiquitin-protein ligase [Rhinatrema bivittatum]
MNESNSSPIQSPACVFCQRRDDCPEKYGEKKTYKEHNLTLHYYCLLMSSGIWQRGEEDEGIYGFLVEDIRKEVTRARRMACNVCKKKGASIGCVESRCKRSYHFPCGIERECIFQFTGNFGSYCWDHRPVQNSSPIRQPGSSPCTICLEFVEHLPTYNILQSPCCKSAWFHRECLQYQALSAGLYFFRCTVCNNKEKFRNEMLRLGIHVPERDASWELETNAYQELLQCYEHCDTQSCHCKQGRDYSQPNSKWEIIRCQYCGSRGTHLACSSLPKWEQSWECWECRSILYQSGNFQMQQRCSWTASEVRNSPLQHSSPKCSRLTRRLQRNVLFRRISMHRKPVSLILKELRFQIKTKHISKFKIKRSDFWRTALKGFRCRTFHPTNNIKIQFLDGRCSQKTPKPDGSKAEFFCLLMHCLQSSSLFEGRVSKNLALNLQALRENLYYEAGRMIAISLVHGGPSPSFLSRTLFSCLVYGPEQVEPTVEDLTDYKLVEAVMRIKSSRTQKNVMAAINDCPEYFFDAGCLRLIYTRNEKDTLVRDVLTHHVIGRVASPFKSFRQGLQTLGVLEKIQTYPDAFWSVLGLKPEKLTAKAFGDLFVINFSTEGSKSKMFEVKVIEFWMDYLIDAEDGKTVASLEEILNFATGTDSVPPVGFDPVPVIEFLHGKFPVGNSSINCLGLPVTNTYKEFKEAMDLAISAV